MGMCSGEQGVFAPLSYRGSTKNDVIQIDLQCYLHCLVFQLICCGAPGYHQYPRCLQHLPSCHGLSLLCPSRLYLCLSRRWMPMPMPPIRPSPCLTMCFAVLVQGILSMSPVESAVSLQGAHGACSHMRMCVIWHVEGFRKEEWRRIPRDLCEATFFGCCQTTDHEDRILHTNNNSVF